MLCADLTVVRSALHRCPTGREGYISEKKNLCGLGQGVKLGCSREGQGGRADGRAGEQGWAVRGMLGGFGLGVNRMAYGYGAERETRLVSPFGRGANFACLGGWNVLCEMAKSGRRGE